MTAPFNVGDVVVCINTSKDGRRPAPTQLKMGGIYRVSGLHISKIEPGLVAVFLAGISRNSAFLTWRFRKIDDEVTEDFRQVLKALHASPAIVVDGVGRVA